MVQISLKHADNQIISYHFPHCTTNAGLIGCSFPVAHSIACLHAFRFLPSESVQLEQCILSHFPFRDPKAIKELEVIRT